MSVLACTIGVLVVLLAVMSLSAVGASSAASAAGAAETERDAALSARLGALGEDEREIEAAEAAWERVDAAFRSRGLETEGTAFDLSRRATAARREAETRVAIDRMREETERLERERGDVEATIADLASRRETLPILIDPTGISRQWTPYFIECAAEGLTAYRARDDLRYFVPRDEVAMIGDLARYLRRVRAEPGSLLVLLIRSDGLEVANETKNLANAAGIRVASLPLPGQGVLDWSLLRRAEGGG